MVTEITRTLVKSEEIIKDGTRFLRLYWFDHSNQVTNVIDSKVMIGYVAQEDVVDKPPVDEVEVVQSLSEVQSDE